LLLHGRRDRHGDFGKGGLFLVRTTDQQKGKQKKGGAAETVHDATIKTPPVPLGQQKTSTVAGHKMWRVF
jgi:hypothetical protein